MLHVLLYTINDVYSHVLLLDDGLTEQNNLKPSEVSSLGYVWSGDEVIDVVIACRLPRQHKRTNEPPCSTIRTFTCTHVQTINCTTVT